MARDRAESPHDRVLDQTSGDDRYRVAGVEPHGWSTVLIEDQLGRFYVSTSATGRLTEVRSSDALQMIQDRVYRRWHGDRSWTSLDRLPLVAQPGPRPAPPVEQPHEEPAH